MKNVIDGYGFWFISRKAFCVYKDGSEAKINITEEQVKECHFIDVPVPFTANGVDAGFVATMESYQKVDEKNGNLFVKGGVVASFRGTDFEKAGVMDIIRDIDAITTDFMIDGRDYGAVHDGFYKAVKSLIEGTKILEEVRKQLDALPQGNKRLYVVGHSKGGAMANLFAMFAKSLTDDVVVVNYGAPRCASREFAKNYDIPTYSYVSFMDAVPHLPFTDKEEKLLKFANPFGKLGLPAYLLIHEFVSLGERVDVFVDHKPYTDLPKSQNNANKETLNSMAAIEWMFRKFEWKAFDSIHNDDYDESQDKEEK